jgi:hypothetical protein
MGYARGSVGSLLGRPRPHRQGISTVLRPFTKELRRDGIAVARREPAALVPLQHPAVHQFAGQPVRS